ncbi:ATP-binding cassette domain-containing protein [Acuticoccus sp. MNP-M23]|uniref:ATP-binding cassette domain-containing protein n=1 Tax=Acuticoccus sp. MNP-M23 TaxID=3072793 RepID=UPI0028157B9E|nr:ATP-binding cassette domain-containing protein [Acuticoccus sp. MNP-M23]WMS40941.1 ATP-binding cassette domain-containing protein [Acuticoccus sp. MNP-M23]
MAEPILELRNVSKHFGATRALTDVSVALEPGKIHCLLGDNGAGKSTLIKVMSGYHAPSSGEIRFGGRALKFASPRHARQLGIATVHQDVGTIPLMSVGRNFFLGAEPTKGRWPVRWLDRAKANAIALSEMQRFGITRIRDAEQLVGTMSGGERQVLAIGRAMYFGAKVLILDEPTSALGVKESAIVLKMMKQVAADGIAVIFITHNARHAMAVGDDFSVLIHGAVAASFRRGEVSRDELLNLMAGGEDMAALEVDLDAVE